MQINENIKLNVSRCSPTADCQLSILAVAAMVRCLVELAEANVVEKPAATESLLKIPDAATMLNICPKSLYNITKKGELRAIRIGTSVRYDIGELLRYIEWAKGERATP